MRRLPCDTWTACLLCLLLLPLPAAAALQPTESDPAQPDAAAPANPADAKPDDKSTSEDSTSEKATPEKKPTSDKDAAPEKKPTPAKKPTVVRFVLKGDCPEGPVAMGLFEEMQQSLAETIRRIDQAGEDTDVSALWLQIESLEAGRGKIHELRAAVKRFRKSGKPVYAELSTAETGQYLLAAACDEIVMPSSGMLLLPGVRAEITFYKGLLDKLGVRFDALQMGKYKGAAEPLTRTAMSGPLRESMEAIVDDTYEDIVATVAADRGLADDEVKTLLDQGLFTAAAAKNARLIDGIAYADELETALCKRLRAESLNVVTDYKKKKIDTDFSGISGMMKFMELLMGGKPSQAVSTRQKVAVVYAVGPIMQGKSVSDLFGSQVLGSTTLVAALRQAADDPKVVAIVLRIDSPGGSAVASDLIWREVVRIKKPIIASMGDVAGSGGYYIAMGANRIFAEPGTLTGSIGVIGGKPVFGGLYEKIGLTTETISRGKNSGSFSATEPFTPEQREAWTALLQETYRQFVDKAAQGRKLAVEELEKLAQGRVYTGRMAVANGLVDELGTLGDAIAAAKKAAGLDPDEKVELLILPRAKTIFEQLFGGDDDSATLASLSAVWQAALPASALSASLKDAPPELSAALRQAMLIRRLFAEPSLLWMPYRVEMK